MAAAPGAEDLALYLTDAVTPAVNTLADKLAACAWDKSSLAAAIKETLVMHSLKMPQLAMPVRVLLMGTAQTPSLDAVLELMARETVLQRLQNKGKNVL